MNGERERRVQRAWWWGKECNQWKHSQKSLRNAMGSWNHQKKSLKFFVEVKVFFGRKIRKIQKEWSLKKKHFLFKSSTAIKWWDMAFIRSNIYLPKHKKWRDTTMTRSTLLSHVSILNIAGHDCWSVNTWTNVTVKGLCH